MFGNGSITLSVPDTQKYLEKIQRNMIGFDDWFNEFDQHFVNTNYPPYNSIKVSENQYRLEVALAGFKKDNIKVFTQEGKLTIEGKKEDGVAHDYVHKGLAQRAFTRTWALPEELVIESVKFEDGLLLVDIKKVLPESQQRKDWL
tara:strand:+ start:633 stop:1067 length:435 start_codon:yes stop_codon:yes gene_type:complete